MRNLKRAFSMVLALVMVLGMITIPATAAEGTVSESIFADANEITYGEAVAITGGIGLFAGTDGKFLPKGTVTRAQMATIIVKMLHGAEANADSFKGNGKFTDVADFEGGWAEGYINWCATLGVVSGYGDGTFRPGNQVTTAEAATMILNALKIDAGEGTWPTTVMSKAAEDGIFEDLKPMPGTSKALNREQLAVMALNGLNYSATDETGWYVTGGSADEKMTFETFKEANKYAEAVDGKAQELKGRDSLARTVFDLKKMEGWITANQASVVDANYTELTWFDGSTSGTERFSIATDESMLGHKVEIWYEEAYVSDRLPGKTFSVVETAQYITLLRDAVDADDYKTALDRRVLATGGLTLALDGTREVYTRVDANVELNRGLTFVAGTQAPAGTYVIDNESNAICGYIAPATLTMGKVGYVDTAEGNESISVGVKLFANNEERDEVNEYEGIAKGDYIIYSQVQEKYTLSKLESITGTISKYSKRNDDRYVVTVNGEQYVTNDTVEGSIKDINNAADLPNNIKYQQEYVFYLAPDNTIVGYETEEGGGGFDLSNTFFVLDVVGRKTKDSYGNTGTEYFARGVDMTGNEAMIPVGFKKGNEAVIGADDMADFDVIEEEDGVETTVIEATTNNFYTVEDVTEPKEARDLGLKKIVPFYPTYDKNNPDSTIYSMAASDAGEADAAWLEGGQFEYGVLLRLSGGRTAEGVGWLVTPKECKYVILNGTATQDEPLEVTVLSSEEANLFVGGFIENRMLLSRQVTGGNNLEVMVLLTNMDRVTRTNIIYVSENQIERTGYNDEVNIFTVYNAITGEEMDINLEGITELSTGFYSLGYDSERDLHLIAKDEEGAPIMLPAAKANETAFESSTDVTDGRKYENVAYDAQILALEGTTLTTDITGRNTISGTKIIDVRTDEEVRSSGVARITSLEQMWGMIEATEGRVRFEMDMCHSVDAGKVSTIFVEVYNNTELGGEESNTVVYFSGDETVPEVEVITSDMYEMGHKISVEGVDLSELGEGIYEFKFLTNNEIQLVRKDVTGKVMFSGQQIPEGAKEFNAIRESCPDLSVPAYIEYTYVKDMNLLVVANATDELEEAGETPIGTEAEELKFTKTYNMSGVAAMNDLTSYNFVELAGQYRIEYELYSTLIGDADNNLMVVTGATPLYEGGRLPNSYETVWAEGTQPAGVEDVAEVYQLDNYDVKYVVCGNEVYVLECTEFVDYDGDTLSATELADGANLRLTKDTTLTGAITISGKVMLDLNGHTLTGSAAPYFTVSGAAAKLTIRDRVGSGKIVGMNEDAAATSAMLLVSGGGELVLNGGALTGHVNGHDKNYGGAVHVGEGSKFTMTGGAISDNKTTHYVVGADGKASGSYGGGVFVGKNAKVTISGGVISGNYGGYRGGGITVGDTASSGANVTITGTAVIENNGAKDRGGNLYFYDANVTFGGKAKIGGSSCTVTGTAQDNVQLRGGTMKVTGAEIKAINTTAGTGGVEGTISGSAKIDNLSVGTATITVEKLVPGAKIVAESNLAIGDDTVKASGTTYEYAGK